MKAVAIRNYGSPEVMNIEEIGQPAVADDELLVRVRYSSVNPIDWKIRNGSLRLLVRSRFPMTLGFDIAGEVVDEGRSVRGFKGGDRVLGMLSLGQRGAYAEYVRTRENNVVMMSGNIDFREAAAIPLAGLTAYQALHGKGRIRSGQTVLINGASGGVGSFAVQIARAAGASVTAVCGTNNIELVKTLGAERVIDYRKQDFTQSPERYDIIFDAVGMLSFFKVRRNLTDSGRYVTTLPNVSIIVGFVVIPVLSLFGYRKKSAFVSVKPDSADLGRLMLLVKEMKLIPLIDRVFGFEEIREAHAYSEKGHARGKIVIRIS